MRSECCCRRKRQPLFIIVFAVGSLHNPEKHALLFAAESLTEKSAWRNALRKALTDARTIKGPVVIVVPTIQHANLPASNVWWDVAPAEVSTQPWVAAIRTDYEAGLSTQRWHA